jgi:endonuclease G
MRQARIDRRFIGSVFIGVALVSGVSCHPPILESLPPQVDGNDNVKYGWPGGEGTILVKHYYVILHADSLRIPEYVTYHLTRADLNGTTPRSNDFRPEPGLPAGARAELTDYEHSGYDRGHMAPADDFNRDSMAMSESFVLSNMSPQRPNLNRKMWERLEEQVRSLASDCGNIWLVTGSLFLDSLDRPARPAMFIGPDRVAVPTHFYKAILCERQDGTHEMFGFIMQNRDSTLPGEPKDYIVSVRHIETLASLDFFNRLSRAEQDSLETRRDVNWPPG